MTRCMLLSTDAKTQVLITLDINTIPKRLAQEITDRASYAIGIQGESIQVAATGNATAPALDPSAWSNPAVQRYTDFLPDIVAGNALMAASKIKDAAAGYTTLRIPNISCYRDPDPRATNLVRLETTKLLAIQDSNDIIIATVISNPCPAIVRKPSRRWTADYPGALCWMLQQSGIEAPIFVKGDSSGIMPFDWFVGNPNPSHPDHSADDANALALIIATQVAQALPSIIPKRNIRPSELLAPFT